MYKSKILFSIYAFIGIFALSGCSSEKESNGKLKIVTTTTMIYDIGVNIGGDHVEVKALMSPGIDPHLFKASAGDVNLMQEADIVIYNGIHLEGKMADVFEALSKSGNSVICIEDGIDKEKLLTSENESSVYDPHIWFDVDLWKDAAKHVAGELSKIDEKNAVDYEKNLKSYLKELDTLDAYIKERTNEIGEDQRVLVTAHDAFRYFARAYGYEVKGLQGISTEAEAGTADVSSLADFIYDRKIKAIFVESSVPAKTIEALKAAVDSRGFTTEIGGELYSDSLGDEKSGTETYVLTFKANIDTIVNALK